MDKDSSFGLIGDAEAILSVSENAEDGIYDLVDAYKSGSWDNNEAALQIVQDYGTKLRQRFPGEQAGLSPQEALQNAPIKPIDVGMEITKWEEENKKLIPTDPFLRAYADQADDAITKAATAAFQQANNANVSWWQDKINRTLLGAAPGIAHAIGADTIMERNLRADSNDTLPSTLVGGAGSVMGALLAPVELPLRVGQGLLGEYAETRASGASVPRAVGAAALEGANQALDVVLDRLFLGPGLKGIKKVLGPTVSGALEKVAGSGSVPRRALWEGGQEWLQNNLSELADFVGLSQDDVPDPFTKQDLYEGITGVVVGGAASKLHGTQQVETPPTSAEGSTTDTAGTSVETSLSQELGLETPFPETEPRKTISTIGEPVNGSPNVTVVEDAGTETLDKPPAMKSDAGEEFIANPDGTTQRVVNGEVKQAHANSIQISEETAQKLANLQVQEIDGGPVAIRTDDLGRPYINHPKVDSQLNYSPNLEEASPVLIPESDSGHLLQTSESLTDYGSIDRRASISRGKVTADSTGAMKVEESSVADKLRQFTGLDPKVREILDLDVDGVSLLVYPPGDNQSNRAKINDVFARYDNNYLAFAADIDRRGLDDLNKFEQAATGFAANAFNQRAKTLRLEGKTDIADKYASLASKMYIAYQATRSETGQNLQLSSLVPITGDTLTTAARVENDEIAVAKVAIQNNMPIQKVQAIDNENKNLDVLNKGLLERDAVLNDEEARAEEIATNPERRIAELQKQIDAITPEEGKKLTEAQKATKAALKEEQSKIKSEAKETKKSRKDALNSEKERIKTQRDIIDADRKKLEARKVQNKKIKDAIDQYKKDFENKLTPEVSKKIDELVEIVNTKTGLTKQKAFDNLGRTIAAVKGIPLEPNSNPWSAIWQANALTSLGTQVANIYGNITVPAKKAINELTKGNVNNSYKFVRGWTNALLSTNTLRDIREGLSGNIDSRPIQDIGKDAVTDISKGVHVAKERDTFQSLKKYFGGGKLGALLASPSLVFRALGATDAVFARSAKEGYLAMQEPTYNQYLKSKKERYESFLEQARNEEAQLKRTGTESLPSDFVQRRADELSFEALPEERRARAAEFAAKAVLQNTGGPTGATARFARSALERISGTPFGESVKDLNARTTVASALRLSNKTFRDDVSPDKILPAVLEGVSQGNTLVINGKSIEGNLSTSRLLGEVVNAINNKQIVSLKGESIKPFKYVSGMFVNVASNILDLSMETIPAVGFFDKQLGTFREFTAEEKADHYATQVMATAVTGGLLMGLASGMDDEENQMVYVYGGMRDPLLRKEYSAKGIKPFTVRVGSYTWSYKDVPGVNLVLAGIGGISDAMMTAKRDPNRPLFTGSALQMMGTGLAIAGTEMLYGASQYSMIKNISVLADALGGVNGDSSALKGAVDVAGNIFSNFVPYAGAARELERFQYGDLARPSDLTSRIIQNIPTTKFFSENKPALNLFGEPVNTSTLPGIGRLIGTAKDSPEMDWLLRNGYTVSIPKSREPLSEKQMANYQTLLQSDDPDTFEPFLTDEDQYKYQKLYGPELKALLNIYSKSYPQGFDPAIQKALTRDVNKVKATAKRQILQGQ